MLPAGGGGVAADAPQVSLVLIGDAGSPATDEPVLRALQRELASSAPGAQTVFLGDNVYPSGLPAPGASGRREAERRLLAQIAAVREAGASALFLPGNHDWEREGAGGWEAVRRQAAFVAERGGERFSFLPRDGCPGPEVRDLGERLRLVLLDTQWWLHGGPRPLHPDSSCSADSEQEVLDALRASVAGASDRQVVLASHHPPRSGGAHGRPPGWLRHLFPLREWKPSLWLPLPGFGSAYALSRNDTAQELHSPANRRMREALASALKTRPPLVWAAGHDHDLQVIEGGPSRYVLVSGAGVYGRTRPVAAIDGTLYRSPAAGFMRLEAYHDGRVRLVVLEVDRAGRSRHAYARWLSGQYDAK
jgi:hypothetical protein